MAALATTPTETLLGVLWKAAEIGSLLFIMYLNRLKNDLRNKAPASEPSVANFDSSLRDRSNAFEGSWPHRF